MCAGLFLWRYRPYVSWADVDEFLLISKPDQSVGELLADPACFNSAHTIGVPHHQASYRPTLLRLYGMRAAWYPAPAYTNSSSTQDAVYSMHMVFRVS